MVCVKRDKFLTRMPEFRALIGYRELEARVAEQSRTRQQTQQEVAKPARHYDPGTHPGYPVPMNEDADLTILQRYLRSSGYSLVKQCQRLTLQPTKSRFLVKHDETGEQYLMSVGKLRPQGMALTTDKQRKRFISFLTGLNVPSKATDTPSPFIHKAVSADFDLNSQRSFVVREIVKNGSLRDVMYNKAEWNERFDAKYKKKASPLKVSDIAYYGMGIVTFFGLEVSTLHGQSQRERIAVKYQHRIFITHKKGGEVLGSS